jgi:glycosyltransferase involved in cell wall biosynthesis
MKLSIIMPVYNEINTIEAIIHAVKNAPIPDAIDECEIIIVDDGSHDGTGNVLRMINDAAVKVLSHKSNMGKGAAIRTGFEHAGGDIMIIQDADLEYNPLEYPDLLTPIIENKADVVYGSRFIMKGEPVNHYRLYFLANKILTFLSNLFSRLKLTDMETCYKVFTRDVINKITIEEDGFGFEPEITAKIGELVRKQDIRVYETGISYFARSYKEGKKIGMSDAILSVWCIIRYNTSGFAVFIKYGTIAFLMALLLYIINL